MKTTTITCEPMSLEPVYPGGKQLCPRPECGAIVPTDARGRLAPVPAHRNRFTEEAS